MPPRKAKTYEGRVYLGLDDNGREQYHVGRSVCYEAGAGRGASRSPASGCARLRPVSSYPRASR